MPVYGPYDGALCRVITAAIEGTADQIWSRTVADRRADTAAVNAIASGSRHSTMRAISNRIAFSSSPPCVAADTAGGNSAANINTQNR
jgi:hypothetical protein